MDQRPLNYWHVAHLKDKFREEGIKRTCTENCLIASVDPEDWERILEKNVKVQGTDYDTLTQRVCKELNQEYDEFEQVPYLYIPPQHELLSEDEDEDCKRVPGDKPGDVWLPAGT